MYRFYRELPVADSHDDSVFGFGGDFEAGWEGFFSGVKGVIAAYQEGLGESFEDSQAAMVDWGGLAVHRVVKDSQFSSERFYYALEAEADSENGDSEADCRS